MARILSPKYSRIVSLLGRELEPLRLCCGQVCYLCINKTQVVTTCIMPARHGPIRATWRQAQVPQHYLVAGKGPSALPGGTHRFLRAAWCQAQVPQHYLVTRTDMSGLPGGRHRSFSATWRQAKAPQRYQALIACLWNSQRIRHGVCMLQSV